MELDADYKKDMGNGHGSEVGYIVEARNSSRDPQIVGGQIFDNRWRRVSFEKSIIGVPQCAKYSTHLREHGYLMYASAQALRWWLHANAEIERTGICLETRLIKIKITHTHKVEAISAHKQISGDDRSNILPD